MSRDFYSMGAQGLKRDATTLRDPVCSRRLDGEYDPFVAQEGRSVGCGMSME